MGRRSPPVVQRFHQDTAVCRWARLIGISLGIAFAATVVADAAQHENSEGSQSSRHHQVGTGNGSPGLDHEGIGAGKESELPSSGGKQETEEDCA